jgi:outer membrane protein OmpA-like peptidoglycan-associated protein
MKRTTCFILIILSCLNFSFSQKIIFKDHSFGGFVQYNFNFHDAGFTKLPEVPNCCPLFEKGNGKGISFGALYENSMFSPFIAKVKLGYFTSNGLLSAIESEVFSVDGKGVAGEYEHQLNASISTIGLEPSLSYKIIDNLRISLGFNAGFLINKKYEQKEEIIKPSGVVTFLDSTGKDTGKRTRNEVSGIIPNVSNFQIGLMAEAEYELPMNKNKTLNLLPTLSYKYGLTPVVKGLKWYISSLNLGFSIKYNPLREPDIESKYKEFIDTIPRNVFIEPGDSILTGIPRYLNDTIYSENKILLTDNYFRTDTIKKYKFVIKIKSVGADEEQEYPHAIIKVEEFLSTNIHPLLNYIFFSHGSAEIPAKYNMFESEKTESFQINKLHHYSPLESYYQVLNIIGSRMINNPDAKIKLIGCNSNTGEEINNTQLSEQRAKAVYKYLVDVWKINPQRMSIETRNLPKEPSNPDIPDGIEENQRVEITSNKWEILEPVITNDTLRTVTPSIIRTYYDVTSEAGINVWKQIATQNNKELKTIAGKDSIPGYIDWQIDKEKETIPKSTEQLDIKLNATDKRGITKNAVCSLPIDHITIKKKLEKRIGDKKIEKYNLILFEFDKMNLNTNNLRIIEIIKNNLEPDSRVSITGYTDRMGEDDYNLKLSERRAQATSNELKKYINEKDITARGLGESELYKNYLPEGRFYNRTVEIIVETPVKW